MKKKWAIGLILSILLICGFSISTNKVSAASWGAKELFTTPKATRGTWYYKEHGKIKKWRITAHTSHGRKLYKMLPSKAYAKWERKLEKRHSLKLISALGKKQWQAIGFKYHGKASFNTNGWLAGAGAGLYYCPVTRTRHGKKVNALRFGSGAGNWLDFYAYKSKSLAR